MSALPWYAVTISPLRVLAVVAVSAAWLCIVWGWVSTMSGGGFVCDQRLPGHLASHLGTAMSIPLVAWAATNIPWSRLNPSITIGKPRPPRPPKATAREVRR